MSGAAEPRADGSVRRAAASALLAVVACLTAAAAIVLPDGPAGAHVAAPSCGRTVNKPSGARWICTFDEEFAGSTLDPRRWSALETASTGFHNGPECFVTDPAHVRVARGGLTLTATRGLRARCGTLVEPYRSGMVTSRSHFRQAYGRFEIRARLASGLDTHSALWLYPQTLLRGHWPMSGEIDLAELWGTHPGAVWPHLHYVAANGTRQHPGRGCPVAGAASTFHTYAVTWTPSSIAFAYDGRPCLTVTAWTPVAPLARPAPFDRPFYVNLELAMDGWGLDAGAHRAPQRASMTVDYVRVWR